MIGISNTAIPRGLTTINVDGAVVLSGAAKAPPRTRILDAGVELEVGLRSYHHILLYTL